MVLGGGWELFCGRKVLWKESLVTKLSSALGDSITFVTATENSSVTSLLMNPEKGHPK